MSSYSLTKTRFKDGIWEGLLIAHEAGAPPEVSVRLRDRDVTGVTVTQTGKETEFVLRIPVPIEAVGDGVQTFLISDMTDDSDLGSFSLIAGEVLDDDIRTEVDLLRAELDMLKRAFRRHCLETT
ncbi:MAG: hypothetical protein N4A70_06965 [Pelagimonas sp.]|jgi:hypothetical protein|nr:hypothetical protein [Pelagimonas sp.]